MIHGTTELFAVVIAGAAGLLVLNLALMAACYALLKSGWRIKA